MPCKAAAPLLVAARARPYISGMTAEHALQDFIDRHPKLFILTGAGVSTGSGIPDYRDEEGQWKRPQPVTYQAFMKDDATRRRYWARSLVGWRHMGHAKPGLPHRALARLEQEGRSEILVTQNVDRLHQAAGSREVIDLHGRIDRVRCLAQGHDLSRQSVQEMLVAANPAWAGLDAPSAPDGDAMLEGDFTDFAVPACPHCQGMLKPDVVFFGESVPQDRVTSAFAHLARADAVLVAGSSLMVRSGYRFVEAAAAAGKPIAAVNLGRTRADPLLTLKVEEACETALAFLVPAEVAPS
jgi:NAD-dependent SIR2 family protein deacetylase